MSEIFLDFGTTVQKQTDGQKVPVVLLALDQGRYDMARSLDELRALADANGMEAVAEVVQKRATPGGRHPAGGRQSGRSTPCLPEPGRPGRHL